MLKNDLWRIIRKSKKEEKMMKEKNWETIIRERNNERRQRMENQLIYLKNKKILTKKFVK